MCFRLCAECECVCLEYMLFLYDRVCLQYRWAIYYIPIQADAIARWKLVESERWINCVHMPWYSRHLLQISDHMCLVHNRKPIKYNTSNYAHKTKLKWKRRNTHTHTFSQAKKWKRKQHLLHFIRNWEITSAFCILDAEKKTKNANAKRLMMTTIKMQWKHKNVYNNKSKFKWIPYKVQLQLTDDDDNKKKLQKQHQHHKWTKV